MRAQVGVTVCVLSVCVLVSCVVQSLDTSIHLNEPQGHRRYYYRTNSINII